MVPIQEVVSGHDACYAIHAYAATYPQLPRPAPSHSMPSTPRTPRFRHCAASPCCRSLLADCRCGGAGLVLRRSRGADAALIWSQPRQRNRVDFESGAGVCRPRVRGRPPKFGARLPLTKYTMYSFFDGLTYSFFHFFQIFAESFFSIFSGTHFPGTQDFSWTRIRYDRPLHRAEFPRTHALTPLWTAARGSGYNLHARTRAGHATVTTSTLGNNQI